MKKKNYIILFALIAFLITSFCICYKDKIVFHGVRYTSSDVEITKWFIKDTSNINFVEESIDIWGRTKELRFYDTKHKLNWVGSGYYGGAIVKYDYYDNKIVETFFSSDSEIANDFRTSEVPYRHVYYLEGSTIKSVSFIYKIDFQWNKESLDSTINHLKFYQKYNSDNSELKEVFGYRFASAKYKGINPGNW
jgi:hypothetical protein